MKRGVTVNNISFYFNEREQVILKNQFGYRLILAAKNEYVDFDEINIHDLTTDEIEALQRKIGNYIASTNMSSTKTPDSSRIVSTEEFNLLPYISVRFKLLDELRNRKA